MNDETTAADQVQCPADRDPAVRLFIGAGLCLGFAIWCLFEKHAYDPPEAWTMKHINDAAGYVMNHFGPWLFIPVAAFLSLLAVRALRRLVVADAEGISINRKGRLPWSDFTGVDASALQSKGRLALIGRDGSRVVLDQYQYKNFKALVELIEQHLGSQQPDASA